MIAWLYNNLWWIVGISTLIIAIIIFLLWLWRRRNRRYLDLGVEVEFEVRQSCCDKRMLIRIRRSMWYSWPNDSKIESVVQPEWYEVLQEELNRLPIGKVVFNPPDVMRLGVKGRIETRISRDINANLLASLKGRGIPKSEELKISELMKVRLSGCDFNIVSLNEEEQVIEKTGFTEWAWDVTPKKSGKRVLHLHVTLRIRLPFGEERKDHPVLDREIVVKVNPAYSVKIFLISYWKWIVTALILPLIGLAWKIYTKK